MRLVICWAELSGYMASCWRALAAIPGIDLSIIAWASGRAGAGAAFSDDLAQGLPCRLLEPDQRRDSRLLEELVFQQRPDVLMVSGWFFRPYRDLVRRAPEGVKKVLAIDTPWRGTLRQHFAKFFLSSYLRDYHRVLVPGERSFTYGLRLGIPEKHLRRGVYGIDAAALAAAFAKRQTDPGGWPRRFLFMGRYAPEKGIEVMLHAYRRYRERVSDPWPLRCHGSGPLKPLFQKEPGVEDGGFAQPREQIQLMAQHGVMVLASTYDPWPLVIVEGCAAGLPVLCSNACGSAVELVRPYYNGLMVAPKDAEALADGMIWMHRNHDALPEMGRASVSLAAPYAAEVWARRMVELCRELCDSRSPVLQLS